MPLVDAIGQRLRDEKTEEQVLNEAADRQLFQAAARRSIRLKRRRKAPLKFLSF
jgi:hypothetical protein